MGQKNLEPEQLMMMLAVWQLILLVVIAIAVVSIAWHVRKIVRRSNSD